MNHHFLQHIVPDNFHPVNSSSSLYMEIQFSLSVCFQNTAHYRISQRKVHFYPALRNAIGPAVYKCIPDCLLGAVLRQHAHASMLKYTGNTVIVTGCNHTNGISLFQSLFIGCLSGSRSHMHMTVHGQRSVIVFAASMTGINLCKWRKFRIMRFPVLPSGARLISKMMGNSDNRPALKSCCQFLIPHGMSLLSVII